MKRFGFFSLLAAAGLALLPASAPEPLPPPDYADFSPYLMTVPLYLPVETGTISSHFGWRLHPIGGEEDFHTGTDILCPIGTPVFAVLAGTVQKAGFHESYGNYLLIDHHSGFCSLYAHCSRLTVREGERVKTGERIALSGDTGETTGPHLHLEIRLNGICLDPEKLPAFARYRPEQPEKSHVF